MGIQVCIIQLERRHILQLRLVNPGDTRINPQSWGHSGIHTNTLIQSELRQSTVICLPGLQAICSGKLATKYVLITKVWACVENTSIQAALFYTVPPFVWHSTHENQEGSRINDLCVCLCVCMCIQRLLHWLPCCPQHSTNLGTTKQILTHQ